MVCGHVGATVRQLLLCLSLIWPNTPHTTARKKVRKTVSTRLLYIHGYANAVAALFCPILWVSTCSYSASTAFFLVSPPPLCPLSPFHCWHAINGSALICLVMPSHLPLLVPSLGCIHAATFLWHQLCLVFGSLLLFFLGNQVAEMSMLKDGQPHLALDLEEKDMKHYIVNGLSSLDSDGVSLMSLCQFISNI